VAGEEQAVLRRLVTRIVLAGVAVFAVIQLVPYGRAHRNPPVRAEPAWDSLSTRVLAARACFDCHSNETEWPWYASIAPVAWLIQWDVEAGRQALNYSEWDRRQKAGAESAKTVQKGEMPPWYYTLFQPKARLTPAEREALVRGLAATFGREHGREGEEEKERSPRD
jgi:mono/diheme cytochrome c family protein